MIDPEVNGSPVDLENPGLANAEVEQPAPVLTEQVPDGLSPSDTAPSE